MTPNPELDMDFLFEKSRMTTEATNIVHLKLEAYQRKWKTNSTGATLQILIERLEKHEGEILPGLRMSLKE